MPTHEYHRGIAYAAKEIAPRLWEWTIFPPDCVKGFASATGTVSGTRTCAVDAAKREIEAQDIHGMNGNDGLDCRTTPVVISGKVR